MTDRKLFGQALEALTCSGDDDDPGHRCTHCDDYVDRNGPLRAALRERLAQPEQEPWIGLDAADLDGYSKPDVVMVRYFEQVLFQRNTRPCFEGLPEPIRTPPEKGTKYWTIGLGKWTWGGTTHDYSCLSNGIWSSESDVWKVHAAIRRALGIEPNIAAVLQNRNEAKLREKNT